MLLGTAQQDIGQSPETDSHSSESPNADPDEVRVSTKAHYLQTHVPLIAAIDELLTKCKWI